MSTAEQKMELVKWIVEADEAAIDRLVQFTKQLGSDNYVSEETVNYYEDRSDDFIASGKKGLSKEESLNLLYKQLK